MPLAKVPLSRSENGVAKPVPQVSIRVLGQVDVERSRRGAREQATNAGLDSKEAENWALVATELATNLVRYATAGGQISLLLEPDTLELSSVDTGPGIPDLEGALTDGYSTGGSLGCGLGLVKRLSDEFTIKSSPAGTLISARRRLRR